ncbi:MAG: CaiB/BaiF CoA transferase family protein [Hyphomonadaceae bacterium]
MLKGLRIVELATYVAGPGAAGILCDWGASVIKIEQPGGDPMRKFFDTLGLKNPTSPMFEMDNRGKRSLTLDITKPHSRDVLLALLRQADVFVTNLRPGALKRAKLDWDDVRGENERLIFANITGYGRDGAEADRPGFDIAAFWARSGMAALTAPKGAEPFLPRTAFGDHICALATAAAILAAAHERQATGKGRLVETSLLRAGTYALSADLAIQMRLGRVASTRARRENVSPLANFFKTGDERWFCMVPRQGAGGDWDRVARAAKREDLIDDPRFADAKARRQNTPALVDVLDAAFSAMTLEELGARFDAEGVVWAPAQRPAEVVADPQAHAAGCFTEIPDGAGGAYAAPAGPARFHGVDVGPQGPAPAPGQHTQEILTELGFSAAEQGRMRESGALG